MASIELYKDGSKQLPLGKSYDITGITAEAFGGYANYITFNNDGTMAAVRAQGGTIVMWDHFLPDGTYLQHAGASLALQPFLDIVYGAHPSSVKAFNYLMSGDDTITGSKAHDVLDGRDGADTLNGNGGNDKLLGGNGDDVLNGGLGSDRATGGAGADSFDFHALADVGDKITDFETGIDQIRLDGAAFGFAGALTDGVDFLNAGTPLTGTAPVLIYDQASGALSYDADGSGSGAAQLVATLMNHAALTASDVLIV